MMLHNKYQGFMSCDFRQEDCFKFFVLKTYVLADYTKICNELWNYLNNY